VEYESPWAVAKSMDPLYPWEGKEMENSLSKIACHSNLVDKLRLVRLFTVQGG
jgi:hypothetical protein